MTHFQSIFLGIVQGLTEFLPVSSSGHLLLVPYFFNWSEQSLSFDVALHFGTALAVLVYYHKDWQRMITSLLRDLFRINFSWEQMENDSRQLLKILIVTVPVGVVGLLIGDYIEDTLRSPYIVSVMLVIVSAFMYFSEWVSKKYSEKKNSPGLLDALVISLSQIVALIPGSSRSGMTISTGLLRGYSRESAAKFSFLLATPIILGAALVKLPVLFSGGNDESIYVLSGMLSAFVSGLLAVGFLMKFLRRYSLNVFIIYRILLALLILLYL